LRNWKEQSWSNAENSIQGFGTGVESVPAARCKNGPEPPVLGCSLVTTVNSSSIAAAKNDARNNKLAETVQQICGDGQQII
jgi:hypothetical protein